MWANQVPDVGIGIHRRRLRGLRLSQAGRVGEPFNEAALLAVMGTARSTRSAFAAFVRIVRQILVRKSELVAALDKPARRGVVANVVMNVEVIDNFLNVGTKSSARKRQAVVLLPPLKSEVGRGRQANQLTAVPPPRQRPCKTRMPPSCVMRPAPS